MVKTGLFDAGGSQAILAAQRSARGTRMPTPGKSPVIPSMRYQDAPAAIEWLCNVLGFSKHLVVPLDDSAIAHARLVLGDLVRNYNRPEQER